MLSICFVRKVAKLIAFVRWGCQLVRSKALLISSQLACLKSQTVREEVCSFGAEKLMVAVRGYGQLFWEELLWMWSPEGW